MPEPDDLVDDDVAALQRTDSLDFPATVGELEPVGVLLNENGFCGLQLQLLHVLVIHDRIFELRVVPQEGHFLLREQCFFNSSFRSFNWLVLVHSSQLTLQKVWQRWQQSVNLDRLGGQVPISLDMLEAYHISVLNVGLCPLLVPEGHV